MLVIAVLTWIHLAFIWFLPAQASCTATSMTVAPSAQTCIRADASEGFVAHDDAVCAVELIGPGWQLQPRVPAQMQ